MLRYKHALAMLILFGAFLTRINAQSIVLCESYDDQGNPTGVYSSWDIKEGGGYIYLVYNQSSPLQDGTWYLYLDYDWDNVGTYQAYETFPITPERGKRWFMYDYKFTDVGKYKAAVMYNGEQQAVTYFEINYEDGAAPATTTTDKEVDTYYYEDSKITFCTSVDAEGYPVGATNTFSMNGTGTVDATIYLENNGKPFKTTKMFVDIYKEGTEEVWSTYSIDVQPDWDYVKFVQTFNRAGTYYVDMFNADDTFINTSDNLIITH